MGAEIRKGGHISALDTSGIINHMAGLTTKERQVMEMTDAVGSGPAIIIPQTRPGAMDTLNFGEEETLNTIHPREERKKSVCGTFLVDEQSIYTMETNNPDVMEPDKMDANMQAKDHNVQIDFGKFSVNLGDDTEERWNGSE